VRAIVNTLLHRRDRRRAGRGLLHRDRASPMHRRSDGGTRCSTTCVLVPRAMPGLLAGLAFLWVFLFVPSWLKEDCATLDDGSIWIAYSVRSIWLWLAYGLRRGMQDLARCCRSGPIWKKRPAHRRHGRSQPATSRCRWCASACWASWLMMFLIFEREYSTGVYLLSPGTEVIGAMLVSLWASGATNLVAALIGHQHLTLVSVGLGLALRFGIKLHD
jgi:iron(III) transport system permease protein